MRQMLFYLRRKNRATSEHKFYFRESTEKMIRNLALQFFSEIFNDIFCECCLSTLTQSDILPSAFCRIIRKKFPFRMTLITVANCDTLLVYDSDKRE